jgi:hypothetical protein
MAKSFARSKAIYKAQPRVLVICEDTKSCKDYLEDAARHFRAHAHIEIAHCGRNDPLNIVEHAVKKMHAFESIYCAIDRDTHETFDEAVRLAAKHVSKITIIASYPCYEFWLFLHFGHNRKPQRGQGNLSAADCMVRDLCKIAEMADYSKGGSKGLFQKLLPRLSDARRYAGQVLTAAFEENEPNPSTKLHELIAAFEALGTPQRLDNGKKFNRM